MTLDRNDLYQWTEVTQLRLWCKWKQRLVLSTGRNIILPTFQIVVVSDWYRRSSCYYHSCICKTSLQWYSKSFQWNWASPFTSSFSGPFQLLVMPLVKQYIFHMKPMLEERHIAYCMEISFEVTYNSSCI